MYANKVIIFGRGVKESSGVINQKLQLAE